MIHSKIPHNIPVNRLQLLPFLPIPFPLRWFSPPTTSLIRIVAIISTIATVQSPPPLPPRSRRSQNNHQLFPHSSHLFHLKIVKVIIKYHRETTYCDELLHHIQSFGDIAFVPIVVSMISISITSFPAIFPIAMTTASHRRSPHPHPPANGPHQLLPPLPPLSGVDIVQVHLHGIEVGFGIEEGSIVRVAEGGPIDGIHESLALFAEFGVGIGRRGCGAFVRRRGS
mmetsp:Transcript_9582/g.19971  ORF Transcript_9582/g.19971 Transcript_9582/m.19971 type:complete len:226 (+) Transcript_9582:659-1336(+)